MTGIKSHLTTALHYFYTYDTLLLAGLAGLVAAYLVWLTFTKAGRVYLSGFVEAAYLSVLIFMLWALYFLLMMWFFALLSFVIL